MNFLVPSSEAPCGGQGEKGGHGQKLCGSPFSFPNHLQAPKLTGKDTGDEAVGRERSSEEGLEWGGGEHVHGFACN